MRKAFTAIALAIAGAALFASGIVTTELRARTHTIAAVGVDICGEFLGAVTVRGDGVLTGHEASDPAIAQLVKPLPDTNKYLLQVPCPVGAPQAQAYYAQPER